jgi:predicted esterase
VKWKWTAVAIPVLSAWMWAQNLPASAPVGKIVPKIVCTTNEKQSYALYLPSTFSANRKWPVIYVFDPGGRGAVAVETVRAAAEKYAWIVVGSNNSKNGPQGGSIEAAQAMWVDTQQRFPLDESRRYFAGMSGGARVAVALALGCHSCVAGVIANAAGFPPNASPDRDTKFVYFAAVGNADMNYPEFVDLRPRLNALGIPYRIRIFDGEHGWAPPEAWDEALNWMDIQAMAKGLAPRDAARIDKTLSDDLVKARGLEAKHDWLLALREYQAINRDFTGLADTTVAKNRAAELEKEKEPAKQEKQEKEDVAKQNRLLSGPSTQMEMIASGNLDSAVQRDLRDTIAALKHDAARTSNEGERLVLMRAFADPGI